MMKRRHVLVPVVLVVGGGALLGGCSDASGLTSQSAVFEGLSPEAVDETLALKGDWIASQPTDSQGAVAQSLVVELGTCRAALGALTTWTETRSAEELVLPQPSDDAIAAASPGERPTIPYTENHALLRELVTSTGRDGLAMFLTMEANCAWMPAEPGTSGPSIHDTVAAQP
ncbi:hypothetical protein ACFVSK_11285 [Cellulosimicrobium cellulans]|uniref:hypothetical protein n=1 Tax=Cellulosimicrobium cellulans TaxID=1710 RepID=UPI0036E66AB6